MPARLEDLLNIGARTAGWLRSIGVDSPETLAEMGSVEAWRQLRAAHPGRVSRNALYALEGALLDARWNALPPARRRALEAALSGADEEKP